ncbi:MAG: FAD:protein FMN transferase [Actinomycetota bacterium]|nr:FAD:protein FMN transferase [Actinomycetota bacterium]
MKRVEEIWGTAVGVEVRDDVASAVVDHLFSWLERVDKLFSTWRDDSEIVRIARGTLLRADASPETRRVLDECAVLSVATGGAFDIGATAHLPPPHPQGWCPLDASAMVKGWALDRAAELLAESGVRRFCINAGGDVLIGSGPAPDEPWRIGVLHPWEHDQLAAVVEATDAAVATSGCYERGSHIVDPRTGQPATGLASVTVVADDLATADAYSTAIFALGRDGVDWLRGHPDVDAMAITDERQVFTTKGFDRRASTAG